MHKFEYTRGQSGPMIKGTGRKVRATVVLTFPPNRGVWLACTMGDVAVTVPLALPVNEMYSACRAMSSLLHRTDSDFILLCFCTSPDVDSACVKKRVRCGSLLGDVLW